MADTGGDAAAEPAPLSLSIAYTGDVWHNARGGLRRGTAYVDNLDVAVEIDATPWGWPQLTGIVHAIYNNGGSFSERYVGDSLVVSNIDAPKAARLLEAWLQWSFGGASSMRVGLYDLNSEFDSSEARGLFIGSAFGIGQDIAQTGHNGPSIFPNTSLTLRLAGQLGDWNWKLAALDAVPGDPARPDRTTVRLGAEDGALLVAEAGRGFGAATQAFVGAWRYTSRFQAWDDCAGCSAPRRGNQGAYFGVEIALGARQNWKAFARHGIANAEFNDFGAFSAAGLTVANALSARPQDMFGLAIAHARTSSELRRSAALSGETLARGETVIELTWRAPINNWLTLQPDAQWTLSPGLDPGVRDAFSIGLRFEIDATAI